MGKKDKSWQQKTEKYFRKRDLKEIKEIISFFEKRIGEKKLKEKIIKSIYSFSELHYKTLIELVKVYEVYIGTEVNHRLFKSFIGF